MTYKGYTAVLEIDEEAGELFGTVQGTRDIITFVGATVDEARVSFEKSVDFYLERCAATGKDPDHPYSGKFLVRVPPTTHREIARAADAMGCSLNEVVAKAVNHFLHGPVQMSVDAHGSAQAEEGQKRGKRA